MTDPRMSHSVPSAGGRPIQVLSLERGSSSSASTPATFSESPNHSQQQQQPVVVPRRSSSNIINPTPVFRALGRAQVDREPTPPGVEEEAPSIPPSDSMRSRPQPAAASSSSSSLGPTITSNAAALASGRLSLSYQQQQPRSAASSLPAGTLAGSLPAPPPGVYRDAAAGTGAASSMMTGKYDDLDVFGGGGGGAAAASRRQQPQTAQFSHHHHHHHQQQQLNHGSSPASMMEDSALPAGASVVDDEVFLRECIYAMLATSETLLFSSWDPVAQSYTPILSETTATDSGSGGRKNPAHQQQQHLLATTPRQRDIFNRFALRLGTMRRRIHVLLSGPSSSFLQQSLRRAVERQLVSYSRFVSSLRDTATGTRRLGDVQVACLRVLPKLSALHELLQQGEDQQQHQGGGGGGVKGGALVSKLDAINNHHGGQELAQLLRDVYRETVMPLLYMTLEWLTKGTCSDPFSEFFVKVDKAVPETSDNYWSQRFSLEPSMIPSTFSPEQAQGILLAGKNINFLQKCCRVREWQLRADIVASAQDASFESVDGVIRAAVADTNHSVLKALNEKYHLLQAFQRARLVYLLSSGDFSAIVLQRLEPHLSHPASRVSTTDVQDALTAAVSSMAASNILPPCIANEAPHIAAEIFLPQQMNAAYTGWDVFSISLPFPPPFNTFFNGDTLRVYRRLFRLLWKVKRVEVQLKLAWQTYTAADRKWTNNSGNSNGKPAPKRAGFSSTGKKTNNNDDDETDAAAPALSEDQIQQQQQQAETTRRLRQLTAMAFKHLTHFVTNFQMYLVTEVIEVAWQQLTVELGRCTSVDDIIVAHTAYLNSMLKHALLRESTQNVHSLLNKMLNVAVEFCQNYRGILQATYANNNSTSTTFVAVGPTQAAAASSAVQRCQQSISAIESGIGELLTILEEDGARGGQKLEFLQSLGSRLNFNHFYSAAESRSTSLASNSSSGGLAAVGGQGAGAAMMRVPF